MASPSSCEPSELTEREWREMRRRMTSLQFEPVPETPELLPRSAYGTEDGSESAVSPSSSYVAGDDAAVPCTMDVAMLEYSAATDNDALDVIDSVEAPAATASLSPSSHGTPVHKQAKSPVSSSSLIPLKRKSSASSLIKKPRKPLASSSSVIATPTPSSTPPCPATDLSALEATITSTQDTLRLTILRAVQETTSRLERDAMLERRKLEATTANRVALLQSQIEELQKKNRTQELQTHDSTQTLERATCLMMKWRQRERKSLSMRACFHAWRLQWQRKTHEHTQQQFAIAFSNWKSQQSFLHQWKNVTQQTAWESKLQTQQREHQEEMEMLTVDHAVQLKEMQQTLETATQSANVAQQGRQTMEDDLRQVFLRGVSAMNIEALSMFKTNHQLAQQRRANEQARAGQELQTQELLNDPPLETEDSLVYPTVDAAPQGGESSEELPSEERMIPVKPPAAMMEDPRIRFQSQLTSSTSQNGVMPSSAIASRLLHTAGIPQIMDCSNGERPPAAPTTVHHGLRSAELVELHQRGLHAPVDSQPQRTHGSYRKDPVYSTTASISPAKQRESMHNSMRFQVEMELMRSSVAAATANATHRAGVKSSLRHTSSTSSSSSGLLLQRSSSSSSSLARTKWS